MKNQAEVVNQAKNNNQAAIKSLEIRSKTEEEATKKAIEQLNVNKDDIENIKVEVIEEPNKGFLGFIGAKDGLYKITVTEKVEIIEEVEPVKEIDIAKEFIETMLHNAKINADVIATQENNLIKIDIKGKEATTLIGRRGQTLDAVQFLTSLALNKINKDSHSRVLVDIENYREKREQSLIRYANKVAREVAKTKKTKKNDELVEDNQQEVKKSKKTRPKQHHKQHESSEVDQDGNHSGHHGGHKQTKKRVSKRRKSAKSQDETVKIQEAQEKEIQQENEIQQEENENINYRGEASEDFSQNNENIEDTNQNSNIVWSDENFDR